VLRKTMCAVFISFLILNVFAGQKPKYFSGEWTLDLAESDVSESRLYLAKIEVEVKNDSLIMTRTYENEWGEAYPFDETVTLDGKEYKQTIYDMPRTAAAAPSEDGKKIVFNSTVTFSGDSGPVDLITKETWSLAKDKKMLTIQFDNKWNDEEATTTLYYKKE